MPNVEHFVLVDFENVPVIDLRGIEGKPVRVTLLIGARQKKLEIELVRQIHRLATQVDLVEVGSSGPNALDITLAYYLGVATKDYSHTSFHIVSRDKDFEPMIAHLKSKGLPVTRHNSFALPFLSPPKLPAPPKRTRTVAPFVAPKPMQSAKPKSEPDPLAKVLARLRIGKYLPTTVTRLKGLVASENGGKLSPAEVSAQVDQLIQRGILAIDPKGKVSYGKLENSS